MDNTLPTRSEQINELATALAAAQKEISNPKKEASNPFYKSTYSDLPSVLNVVRDVFPSYGLSFVQPLEIVGDKIYLVTMLMHTSGQWLKSYAPIPCKDPNDPQKFGSSITYFRRYALQAMVGIVGDDDDDDGQKANTPTKNGNVKTAPVAPLDPAVLEEFLQQWTCEGYEETDLTAYIKRRSDGLRMSQTKLLETIAKAKNPNDFKMDFEKWLVKKNNLKQGEEK